VFLLNAYEILFIQLLKQKGGRIQVGRQALETAKKILEQRLYIFNKALWQRI